MTTLLPPTTHDSKNLIKQPHHIFNLVEILRLIFSFLSPHTLIYKVKPVCHLWRDLSREFLCSPPSTAVWSLFTNNEKEICFRENLITCRSLHLKFWGRFPHSRPRQESWGKLQQAVIECQSTRSFRVTKLIAEGDFSIETEFLPFLENASVLATTLTTIRIERSYFHPALNNILAICVNLIDLHLEAAGYIGAPSVSVMDSDVWENRTTTSLKLQRLTFKHVWISLQLMEYLLPHCPRIKSLDIILCKDMGVNRPGTTGTVQIQLDQFYRLIAKNLPLLEHIHISLKNNRMKSRDAEVFQQLFFKAKSWSFSPSDLEKSGNRPLIMPKNLSNMAPILTSLEISKGYYPRSIGDALHSYLLSTDAVSLLHLRVKDIFYKYAYLDQQKIPRHGVWSCRRLETLHFKVEVQGIVNMTLTSRTILDYLTRLLPRMRDLWLSYGRLSYGLESGLCLLKRMRYLESVYIVSNNRIRFSERDLFWLIQNPSTSQRLRQQRWITALKSHSKWDRECKTSNIQIKAKPTTVESLVSSLGSIEDLIICLEDDGHPNGLESASSLPYLESLVIVCPEGLIQKGKSIADMKKFMKWLRPDCRFRLNGQ